MITNFYAFYILVATEYWVIAISAYFDSKKSGQLSGDFRIL